jgi:hypothetical protein
MALAKSHHCNRKFFRALTARLGAKASKNFLRLAQNRLRLSEAKNFLFNSIL